MVSSTPTQPEPASPASAPTPERSPESPAFECNITPSVHETRATQTKQSFGDGPWFINEDKTIWAADQPYIAGRESNTVWMKPANIDLVITGRRLGADSTSLSVRPPAIYNNSLYLSVGMTFPQPGCWEVTASAGDSKLTFITKVQE
jgi:hypothetical protein